MQYYLKQISILRRVRDPLLLFESGRCSSQQYEIFEFLNTYSCDFLFYLQHSLITVQCYRIVSVRAFCSCKIFPSPSYQKIGFFRSLEPLSVPTSLHRLLFPLRNGSLHPLPSTSLYDVVLFTVYCLLCTMLIHSIKEQCVNMLRKYRIKCNSRWGARERSKRKRDK